MYPCDKVAGNVKVFCTQIHHSFLTNPHNIFAFISDACTSVQQAHRVRSTPHPRTWSTSLPFSLSRQGMGPGKAVLVRGREGHCFRTQQGLAHQKWWMIPQSGGISYRCRDGTSDHLGGDSRPGKPVPLKRLTVGDFGGSDALSANALSSFALHGSLIRGFSALHALGPFGSCSRG